MKKVLSILCCATLCLNLCCSSGAALESSTTSDIQNQSVQIKTSKSLSKAESNKYSYLKIMGKVLSVVSLSGLSALLAFRYGNTSGYESGVKQGYSKGYNQGNQEGYYYGHDDGYNEGVTIGTFIGLTKGYNEGYNVGYDEGKSSVSCEEVPCSKSWIRNTMMKIHPDKLTDETCPIIVNELYNDLGIRLKG